MYLSFVGRLSPRRVLIRVSTVLTIDSIHQHTQSSITSSHFHPQGPELKIHCFVHFASADVFVTDLPEFLDLMSTNVDFNSEVLAGSAVARTLKW